MITRRALLAAFLPAPALAQEFIEVDGPLEDAEFYRLVACAASPPDGECQKPLVRWPTPRRLNLRVGIARIDPGFPAYKIEAIDRALDAAIEEVNATGAHLNLVRAFRGAVDVPLYLLAVAEGGEIAGTGNRQIDGSSIALGRVVIRSRGQDILAAAIAISRDIARREIASVVLEELVQAMGLPTDVASEAYAGSIFSENGNSVVWLRNQDAEVLRLHYPRP